MHRQFQNIALGLVLVTLAFLGNVQLLNAQQNKSASPNLSVVTLDVTGMT